MGSRQRNTKDHRRALTEPATAFAGGGENIDTTPKVPEESTPVTTPLTPDGNLTLVDDIKVEESKDKQFVTLQSKNGNYFYLVIDRSGDKEKAMKLVNHFGLELVK